MFKKKYVCVFALLLAACGEGEEKGNDNPDSNEPMIMASASNSIDIIELDAIQSSVDLSDNIISTSDSASIDITNLSQGKECDIVSVDKMSFEISPSKPMSCTYKYQVIDSSGDELLETAVFSRVLVKENVDKYTLSRSQLTPISKVVSVGEELAINLENELKGVVDFDVYSLSSELTVFGGGEATSNANVITYTANYTLGVTRILYTLESQSDYIIGNLDVATGDSINHQPEAISFSYYQALKINESITVDLENVMLNGNVTSAIDDPDGDDLQLTDVLSFTTNPTLVDPLDIDNKKFTFSANQAGMHYVTYVVSDHYGGYAIGIIEFQVLSDSASDPVPWKDVITNVFYSAPLTLDQAFEQHLSYAGSYSEIGLAGPTGYAIATYNWGVANAYCLSRGMSLPSKNQLLSLEDYYPEGLFVSKDNVDEKINWPTSIKYWTNTSDDSVEYDVVSLSDFDVDSIAIDENTSGYYATCVVAGKLKGLYTEGWMDYKDTLITDSSLDRMPYTLPMNEAHMVSVEVTALDGSIISEPIKVFFSSEKGTTIKPNVAITDEFGIATVFVSSRLEGSSLIKARVGKDILALSLAFDMLPQYARPAKETDAGGYRNILCFYDNLDALLTDNCANAIINDFPKSYDGWDSNNILDDGNNFMRTQGSYLYFYDNLTDLAGEDWSDWISRPSGSSATYVFFFDGEYYWNSTLDYFLYGYKSLSDLEANIVSKTIPIIGEQQTAFTFDGKQYIRVIDNDDGTGKTWIFNTVEDAALLENHVDEKGFVGEVQTGPGNGDKFTILNVFN